MKPSCRYVVCAICNRTYQTATSSRDMLKEMIGIAGYDGGPVHEVCDQCFKLIKPSMAAFGRGHFAEAERLVKKLPKQFWKYLGR